MQWGCGFGYLQKERELYLPYVHTDLILLRISYSASSSPYWHILHLGVDQPWPILNLERNDAIVHGNVDVFELVRTQKSPQRGKKKGAARERLDQTDSKMRRTLVSDETANVLINLPYFLSLTIFPRPRPPSEDGNGSLVRPEMVTCFTPLYEHEDSVTRTSSFLTPGSSSKAVNTLLS